MHLWQILILAATSLLTASVAVAQTLTSPVALTRLPAVNENQAATVVPQSMARPDLPRFTLADLERIARARNPSLGRAAAAVEAAEGKWLQAGLAPDPSLSVGEQQIGSNGRAEQDYFGVSQEITLGGKRRLDRAIAAQELTSAQLTYAAQQLRVQTDVRMAFYSALIAQRQRGVADELVAIARAGVKAAQEAEQETPIGRNDVLEAQIELRSAEIEARTSYYRHLAAWRILGAVVGDPNLPFAELDGDLFLPESERDWNDVIGQLKASSPEISAAMVHVEETRLALARATAEKIPNVTVDGLVNWRDNGIGGDPDGGLQLTLPVPLWNRNRGAVAQAAAEIKSAEHHVEQLKLDLHRQMAEVFERYSVAYFQARHYRNEILPAAQEALELTRANFRAGAVDYNDLLTSQRTNANSNLAYLSALRELWVAEAELDGLLLTGSLDARE